jgi:hypothetical protein
MATLLQCIDNLIYNISVTDRQEESINNSVSNLDRQLKDKENNLYVERTFTNGSWERDTIIRPLDDVDLFAVLKLSEWQDRYWNLPNPQTVLNNIKDYLNSLPEYKGKVKQDRPCVTIHLSDKDFDVLPSFEMGGGYKIPQYDLKTWTISYPEQLTKQVDDVHRLRKYRVKQIIKVVKYWNRECGKVIPSYHIEEVTFNVFSLNNFVNFEEAIRLWFNNAEYYLLSIKFKSNNDYTISLDRLKKVRDKLNKAKVAYDNGKEGESIKIWKDIFGKEFPMVDVNEAKSISKSLSEGSLKIGQGGILSSVVGRDISPSKGFFGEISKK